MYTILATRIRKDESYAFQFRSKIFFKTMCIHYFVLDSWNEPCTKERGEKSRQWNFQSPGHAARDTHNTFKKVVRTKLSIVSSTLAARESLFSVMSSMIKTEAEKRFDRKNQFCLCFNKITKHTLRLENLSAKRSAAKNAIKVLTRIIQYKHLIYTHIISRIMHDLKNIKQKNPQPNTYYDT